MTTIKVQIPVSPETIEREVQLPAYRKDKFGCVYKVISPSMCICVVPGDEKSCCISVTRVMANEVLTEKQYSDCGKNEFDDLYEKTLDILSNLQIQHA